MPLTLHALRPAALAATLALAAWSPSAQAVVILGNLATMTNDTSTTTIRSGVLLGTTAVAAGFKMNVGTDFLLTSASLRLNAGSTSRPLLRIYGTNDVGPTDTGLFTFNTPSFPTGSHETATFTAGSSFVLHANTQYWLMLFNTAGLPLTWLGSSPSLTPTGTGAVSTGYMLGIKGSAPTTSSSIFNTYELNGIAISAVPEPASMLLLAGGLLALGGLSCTRLRQRG